MENTQVLVLLPKETVPVKLDANSLFIRFLKSNNAFTPGIISREYHQLADGNVICCEISLGEGINREKMYGLTNLLLRKEGGEEYYTIHRNHELDFADFEGVGEMREWIERYKRSTFEGLLNQVEFGF